MKRIRIGNDIVLRVAVTRLGEAEDFAGKTLRLELRSPFITLELPFVRVGNVLTATWLGTQQTKTGTYALTLTEDYGEASRNTVDECGAFALVAHSCQEQGLTGTQRVDCPVDIGHPPSGETTDIDLDITAPSNGLSAYDIAVRNGFGGTEQEWLDSLKADAQVSLVLFFEGYAQGVSLSAEKAASPDVVAFDTDRGTFIAGVRNSAGTLTWHADFGVCGAFPASDYGTASDGGRKPAAQKMYFDTESETLCVWDGARLRKMYDSLTDEDIEKELYDETT